MNLLKYKAFEEFGPIRNLLLPAHENNPNVTTLKKIYTLNNEKIIDVGNHINTMYKDGYYIKVKHIKSNIQLIYHNEPCNIFGVNVTNDNTRVISIGSHKDVHIKRDSIVINVKGDDSLFILSVDDDFELTFTKPKVIISDQDPLGEEDWES